MAGAKVTLADPYTGATVAQGTTGENGELTLLNVPEGDYALTITASQHGVYRSAYKVLPGITNSTEAFVQRQTVSYNWTVVPTTIPDNYKIKLESTFETNVPIPVVTVDPPMAMPLVTPGHDTQINLTITNQGLIACEGVELRLLSSSLYEIHALTEKIGVLPAKSTGGVPVMVRRGGVTSGTLLAMQRASATTRSSPRCVTDDRTHPAAIAGPTSRRPDPVPPPLEIDTLRVHLRPGQEHTSRSGDLSHCVAKEIYECLKRLGDATESLPSLGGNLSNAPCEILDLRLGQLDTGLPDCQKAMIGAAARASPGRSSGAVRGGAAGVPGGR